MSLRIKTEDGDIVVADVSGGGGGGYEIIETESDSRIVTAPEGTHFAGILKYEGKTVYYPDRTQTVNFFDPSLVNASIFRQNSSNSFGFSAGTNAYVKFCDVNNSYLGEMTRVSLKINQGSLKAMGVKYIFADGTKAEPGLSSYNIHEYIYDIPSGKTLKSIEIYTANAGTIYDINFYAKVTGICVPTIVTELRKGINESILIVPERIKSLPDYGFSGNIVDLDNCKYYHNNTISVDLHNMIPLETPEIIDIKPLGSPFKISTGETIEFYNSDNVDIPNTVAYKIERSMNNG